MPIKRAVEEALRSTYRPTPFVGDLICQIVRDKRLGPNGNVIISESKYGIIIDYDAASKPFISYKIMWQDGKINWRPEDHIALLQRGTFPNK